MWASKLENFEFGPEYMTTTTMPLFELCESADTDDKKYFLFNDVWSYGFYKGKYFVCLHSLSFFIYLIFISLPNYSF